MVIAIRSTAIGAFSSRVQAEQAVESMLGASFVRDQIGLVLPASVAPAEDSEEHGLTALWSGALFRSLIGVEIPDSEVRYYEEVLQEGRTLVMVLAGDRYPEAMDVLHRCGGK